MAEKKSILEEALLDADKIQRALNANTREMLRSVAREEIDVLVKESLIHEDDFTEDDLPTDDMGSEMGAEETPAPEMGAEETPGPEMGSDDLGGEELAGDMGGTPEGGPEMGDDIGMDADALGGDDMDLTAASDDDVISVYKKLSGEDEIEIVGDDIHLTVSEPGEYIINGAAAGGGSSEMGSEFGDDDLEEVPTGDDAGFEGEDDADVEISMDDEDGESEGEFGGPEGSAEPSAEVEPESEVEPEAGDDEDEIDEQISTNRVAQNRAGGDLTDIKGPGAKLQNESVNKNQVSATKYNSLLTESRKLQTENEEFRKALKKFRTMLVETVVFNSNLSYVTKLFMEHSTTKDEKKNIISRFDEEVTNLKESKKLYKTIANELSTRKPITESIDKKIIKEVTTSSSKQLNESTAYVDPSTQRINDLIRRVENK